MKDSFLYNLGYEIGRNINIFLPQIISCVGVVLLVYLLKQRLKKKSKSNTQ